MGTTRAERWTVAAVLLAAAALLAWRAAPGSALFALDRAPYDLLLRATAAPPHDAVVVVLVDDETLSDLGERWPLGRGTWAHFLRELSALGPAVVAIDAWFQQPAPKDLVELALGVADRLREDALEDIPAAAALAKELERDAVELDGDRHLAKAIAESGRVVLGFACLPPVDDALPTALAAAPQPPDGEVHRPLACPRPAASIAQLALSARDQGSLNAPPDGDGVVRRYPLAARVGDALAPSLALAAVRVARPDLKPAFVDGGAPLLRHAPVADFQVVRFSDLLRKSPAEAVGDRFRDRLVFVGVSATGTDDFVRTPLGHNVPGVLVHAAAASDLLSASDPRAGPGLRAEGWPAWGGAAGGLLLLVAVALGGGRREDPRVALALAAGGAAVWAAIAYAGFRHDLVLPVVPVLLGLAAWLLVRLGFTFQRALLARRRGRAVRRAFQQYLAPPVVEALIADPSRLRLGGERRDITAFFSDIEGFTSLSEKLDPAELVKLLNECLGAMTEIILEEGGIIDKYIGDAIVAMFGAPLDQPDHAARACRAALRCQRALAAMRADWATRGLPDLRVRIGLNSGEALVGNMGSARRFDYTMLGDTVNLAARLEGANAAYGTATMAGEATVARAGDAVAFRELDAVRVKGRRQPVRVFEVVGLPGEVEAEALARREEALRAYRDRRFAEAAAAFAALAGEGDRPAAIFATRCAALADAPPPPEWDGVFEMTSK